MRRWAALEHLLLGGGGAVTTIRRLDIHHRIGERSPRVVTALLSLPIVSPAGHVAA
jgi:hypothetical protein